jgi:hypothetical protein
MKIKKLKKELSVSLANKKINFKNFFLFELKQSKKNLTSEKNILYSKTFVKLISKKVNFSDNFNKLPLKFPLVLKVFNTFENIYEYILDQKLKNSSKIVFVKISNVVAKGNDLDLIALIDPINSFNFLVKLLDRVVPLAKVLKMRKD